MICVQVYYITMQSMSALPTCKTKSALIGAAISSFPPRKHLARAARGQRKSRPFGRQNLGKFHFGGILHASSNLFRA